MELEVKIPESLRKKVEGQIRLLLEDRILYDGLEETVRGWFTEMRRKLLFRALGLEVSYHDIRPIRELEKEYEQSMKPFREAASAFLADYKVELTEKEKKQLAKEYRTAFLEKILDEVWERGKEDAIAYASEMMTSIVEQTAEEILEKK